MELYIPKFEANYQTFLTKTLQALGCQKLFSEGEDFTIFADVHMPVDNIIQKTFLKIDEKGAEAAAATDIIAYTSNEDPHPEKIVFDLNRPFIYGIVENSTRHPLFLGCKTHF